MKLLWEPSLGKRNHLLFSLYMRIVTIEPLLVLLRI